MKKVLSIIIAVLFGFGLNAQTTLTEAPDFSVTDYSGNEINLYEILEGGQYVLLHFNVRTNEATPEVTPPLVEAYKALGCNQHDVFFIGIVPNGTTNITKQYIEEYGIEFPMIHNTDESNGMQGPAMDITRVTYGVFEYPTTLLIAPDKSVVLQDISPMKTVDDIITALTPFGIKEYECGTEPEPEPEPTVQPSVEITVNEVTATTVDATFTPNKACATYFIVLAVHEEMLYWQSFFNCTMEQLVEEFAGDGRNGVTSNLWKEQIPNTEYTIYVLPKDAEGNAGEIVTKNVKTGVLGGTGVSVIDLKVKVMSTTSVCVTATPNEETAEYHYILIEKAYAEEIGTDSTMRILYADPYALYEIDKWEWIDLVPKTDYYAIAQGKNASGEWGEITKVEFTTTLEGNVDVVEFAEINFAVSPNPATSEVKISSEMNGEAEINIFDLTGRCVKNIHVSDVSNATINVEDLDKGVYFINVNGKVEKLVVE